MNKSEEEYSPFLSKEETQREVTKILERDKREEELAKAPKRTWGPPGYRYVKEKGPQTFSFLTSLQSNVKVPPFSIILLTALEII